jgi:hypothetical protein
MSSSRYPSLDPRLTKQGISPFKIIILVTILIIVCVALYFLYKYLFSSNTSSIMTLVKGEIKGTDPAPTISNIPIPYEGGEYTLSLWLYVNSYNDNRNARKHIIDIGGTNFSTVLIALGAFKNTLVVRTHSRDGDSVSPNDCSGSSYDSSVSTETPGSQVIIDGSLTTKCKNTLLKPMALDDGLLSINSTCDLDEFDFQRWTLVTVVLSGRTIDVYMDGKLAKSCIASSYYKVDPTGVNATLLANNGFDGYISNIQATNTALNPSEIYTLYTNGPRG